MELLTARVEESDKLIGLELGADAQKKSSDLVSLPASCENLAILILPLLAVRCRKWRDFSSLSPDTQQAVQDAKAKLQQQL